MTKIAVIRIHGQIGLQNDTKRTLSLLGLHNKFTCAILEDTATNKGMIKKIKDQVTWGELSKELEEKIGDSKILRLHPPVGGFERKGTKKPFKLGGALGNRGEGINKLLARMMK